MDHYVAKLRQRLQEAYELATSVSRDSQAGHKKGYNCKVRSKILCEGDRVLVWVRGLKGTHKQADRWSEEVYIVLKQPNQDKGKVLQWNMLLPIPCLLIGDGQETPDSIKVNKKEKDIHSERTAVSNTESVGSGTDSSISDASNIPDLHVPIPAPRRILRNVPVTTPRLSNAVSLDMSDSRDSVLSLSNDVISAGPVRSISDTEVGNVETESVSESMSEHGSESNNSGIEFSERPAEVSADVVESCNSGIEFSEEPAEVSTDVIENLGTDSEVGRR